VKGGLFPRKFVLELTTKNLGNSPNFLTITHMTLSAERFRSYGISTIDVAAEFYSWTEQQWNGPSIFHLGLAETLEVLNTISDDNSLSFPMVHQNGSKRLAIFELRQSETRPVAESAFLADHTFLYKTSF
jgi:hypothetical protein